MLAFSENYRAVVTWEAAFLGGARGVEVLAADAAVAVVFVWDGPVPGG